MKAFIYRLLRHIVNILWTLIVDIDNYLYFLKGQRFDCNCMKWNSCKQFFNGCYVAVSDSFFANNTMEWAYSILKGRANLKFEHLILFTP